MPTIQESYADHVLAVRALGAVLAYAVEARYQAPPSGVANGGGLVANPTLDLVIDPRRWALSDEVTTTAGVLAGQTVTIREQTKALEDAVARWEGRRGE